MWQKSNIEFGKNVVSQKVTYPFQLYFGDDYCATVKEIRKNNVIIFTVGDQTINELHFDNRRGIGDMSIIHKTIIVTLLLGEKKKTNENSLYCDSDFCFQSYDALTSLIAIEKRNVNESMETNNNQNKQKKVIARMPEHVNFSENFNVSITTFVGELAKECAKTQKFIKLDYMFDYLKNDAKGKRDVTLYCKEQNSLYNMGNLENALHKYAFKKKTEINDDDDDNDGDDDNYFLTAFNENDNVNVNIIKLILCKGVFHKNGSQIILDVNKMIFSLNTLRKVAIKNVNINDIIYLNLLDLKNNV